MRRGLLYVLPLGILLPLVLLNFDRSDTTPHPATISPPLPAHPVDPYDSIRTDLSDYLWPTDASRAITSSFAEYRRTHFHAGIDISTNDRNGYNTFASRDGYISRITVDAEGYGKMLFVRHPDGYTTTYAHLQSFAPDIESRVRTEQLKRESYEVDITCPPTEFPVRKGEVIAFTGETGTGTSHLHFEIRDENMNGVNPFLCRDFQIEDNLPPAVKRFAVIPLEPGSSVDGSEQPRIYTPHRSGTSGAITIHGAVGFGIQVRDKSNGSRYGHGLYRHQILVDGEPVFDIRIDRIPFSETQQIALYYDQRLMSERKGRLERLFVTTPNTIPFLRDLPAGSGILRSSSLADGTHTFTLISSDFQGNRSRVDGTLRVQNPPRFTIEGTGDSLLIRYEAAQTPGILLWGMMHEQAQWTPLRVTPHATPQEHVFAIPLADLRTDIIRVELRSPGGTRSAPQFWVRTPSPRKGSLTLLHELTNSRLLFTVITTEIPDAPPALMLREGTITRSIPLVATDIRRYTGWIEPLDTIGGKRTATVEALFNGQPVSTSATIELYPIAPGRQGRYLFDEGRLVLTFDSLSVYSTTFVNPRSESHSGELHYVLGPEGSVLRDGLTLLLKTGTTRDGLGLYADRLGHWSFLRTAQPGPDGYVTARLRRTLTDIALLTDTEPPSAGSLRVRFPWIRKPLITFRFGDNLSGVDYQELKTYIDNEFVIPEIDGEHHRATIVTPEPLGRGTHRLTIRLKDNLGNAGVTERSFSVR
jgi:murein DD-endopeptidase MepM/ murein hydrolase activator NlpD